MAAVAAYLIAATVTAALICFVGRRDAVIRDPMTNLGQMGVYVSVLQLG